MAGRPKDQAPPGHLTVREAAQMLGITASAVRQRIENGSLTARITTTKRKTRNERRYYIPKENVVDALERDRELRLPTGLAERLDAMSARVVNIDRNIERIALNTLANSERQEQLGVLQQELSALQEQLKAEQAAREAAETEIDNLRNLLPHSEDQPTQQSLDTPVDVHGTQDNDSAEKPETDKKRSKRRIDAYKVRALREEAYLTQEELAKKSGLTDTTISLIEKGHNTTPRRDTYSRLAEALGVDRDELVTYY